MVVLIQMLILGYMAIDVTDRAFCGDVVRHVESRRGYPTSFFYNDGENAHEYHKDRWENDFKP